MTVVMSDLLALAFQLLLAFLDSIRGFIFGNKLRDLRGETAVVTGAGHGIGREVCLQIHFFILMYVIKKLRCMFSCI